MDCDNAVWRRGCGRLFVCWVCLPVRSGLCVVVMASVWFVVGCLLLDAQLTLILNLNKGSNPNIKLEAHGLQVMNIGLRFSNNALISCKTKTAF